MTVAEAREAVAMPGAIWKAALVEGTSVPLGDDPTAHVRLFETKRAANDTLKAREKELVADGYRRKRGALKYGYVLLGRGDEFAVLSVDYRNRKSW